MRKKKGNKINLGRKHSPESRGKMSKAKSGISPWNKGTKGIMKPNSGSFKRGMAIRKGKKLTPEQVENMRLKLIGKKHSLETRRKMSASHPKGAEHPSWKGGITPINRAIRNSIEYKLWREAVFKRDNYTCIWCGARNGNGKTVILHADHIKQFAYFPELRFSIDNGRTLCKPCHKTTETFSKKI